MTLISEVKLKPSEIHGEYGDSANKVLFGTDSWLVVRELNRVMAVRRSDGSATPILAGYNVTDVSMTANKVYFAGEDFHGNPIVGIKDLDLLNAVEEVEVPRKLRKVLAIK